jgi:trehalose 6-phosphate synthase/phosphatase
MGVSEGRLLVVANRLPVRVASEAGEPRIEASTGGLATGLRGPHERSGGLWFGWPGPLHMLRAAQKRALLAELAARRLSPIELRRQEIDDYYSGFANGVLWPVFHYQLDRLPLTTPDWDAYVKVNRRFADAVAAEHRDGDVIWVHDYHLLLVPAMLRERLPRSTIGFFLHIPFPASEVFRVLPWRADLLRGLLGADLIGFHTLGYVRHFAAALLRVLGLEVDIDRVDVDGRQARICALPMGVDVQTFAGLARDPARIAAAAALRSQSGAGQLVVGIDRLDYTKGIPRRLLAFERLLEQRPAGAPPVQLLQVAATSRGDVLAYQSFKRGVDELVGRINGRFGRSDYVPIRYLNRTLSHEEVAELYMAADVLLVTPLRDGLNLVAKEFLATRLDDGGVLVLSEFAGAAAELPEALLVNPYDVDAVARALAAALAMPPEQRRARAAPMRAFVERTDVHRWAASFLAELVAAAAARAATSPPGLAEALARLREQLAARVRACVFFDYDGTLVAHVARPEAAQPDPELLQLLGALGGRKGTEVHLVSGRPREFLDRCFGHLPIGLHAEHGQSSRAPGGGGWTSSVQQTPDWRERVVALLDRVAAHVPGSFVETKAASVAWHYRQVESAFANSLAGEVRLHLLELLSNVGVAVVAGNRVLEVRPQGVHKGQIVARALGDNGAAAAAVLVLGDDSTDEDMFWASPKDAVTVKVGPGRSAARFRVDGPAAARQLLAALLG